MQIAELERAHPRTCSKQTTQKSKLIPESRWSAHVAPNEWAALEPDCDIQVHFSLLFVLSIESCHSHAHECYVICIKTKSFVSFCNLPNGFCIQALFSLAHYDAFVKVLARKCKDATACAHVTFECVVAYTCCFEFWSLLKIKLNRIKISR